MREYQLEKLSTTPLPLVIQFRNDPLYQEIHLHDAIEIVYICHGAGWCSVNGIIHPMSTGDLYVIPVGATHEYYGDPGLSYINCLFNDKMFNQDEMELYQRFLPHTQNHLAIKYIVNLYSQKEIVSLFEKLNTELQGKHSYHLILARSLFIQIIIFIIRNATQIPEIQVSASQKQLGRVLCYIADHLAEKITIKKLAEIAEYKPSYLPKLFHEQIGCGITKYIENRRLERSALALGTTADTVETIALANGFFDASYFIKLFRRRFGMTPLKFREKSMCK